MRYTLIIRTATIMVTLGLVGIASSAERHVGFQFWFPSPFHQHVERHQHHQQHYDRRDDRHQHQGHHGDVHNQQQGSHHARPPHAHEHNQHAAPRHQQHGYQIDGGRDQHGNIGHQSGQGGRPTREQPRRG